MPNLLGTAPNQVPTNADLGKLAFMDVVDTVTNNPYLDTAISDTKPSLLLDFANSKTLDPRITYTRASTATYYDGKTTAVAEQNLLTYSQEFDNAAWTKSSVTVTANAIVAPDGTLTADKLVENTANAFHCAYQSKFSVTGSSYTLSAYVKAAERGYAFLYIDGGFNGGAISINLSTGAVANVFGTTTNQFSVDCGNGWYRVGFTVTANSSLGGWCAIWTSIDGVWANRVYTGDGTSGIYIWGAQLEQRSSVSAYTPTTSSAITNYIPALQTAAAGVPRFDHDPVTGESKGFLIEEQRTNLLTYSQNFGHSDWTYNSNVTINTAAAIAPDGTLTANKIVGTTTNGQHNIQRVPTGQVFSIYLKAGEYNIAYMYWAGNTSYVNLTTGVVTSGSGLAATTQYIANGWWRVTVALASSQSTYLAVGLATAGNAISFAGDGYSGIYAWGAQLEAGSFATSYIPTTSAQVTRSADAASMTGSNFSSWFASGKGTLCVDYVLNSTTTVTGPYSGIYTISDGTPSNRIFAYVSNSSGAISINEIYAGSVTTTQVISVSSVGTTYRLAHAFSNGDCSASLNGAAVVTNAGIVSSAINQIRLGIFYPGDNTEFIGTIKRIAYYPKRLSDAELQEMTL